jgi:hypothetical protein
MLAKFQKREGKVYGLLVREMFEGFKDGDYLLEVEPINRAKRSLAANRLMFGAIVQEMARWNREEGKGAALPAGWWHERIKKECLHVINAQRKDKAKRKRSTLPNGDVVYWLSGNDGQPIQTATSTTQLDSKEFSEYIALACVVCTDRYGYTGHFDFLT